MTNEHGDPPRMTGPFNLYRRKADQQMWMKFEEMACRYRFSRSQMIEMIVRTWLDKNYVTPGPHNSSRAFPPDNS